MSLQQFLGMEKQIPKAIEKDPSTFDIQPSTNWKKYIWSQKPENDQPIIYPIKSHFMHLILINMSSLSSDTKCWIRFTMVRVLLIHRYVRNGGKIEK